MYKITTKSPPPMADVLPESASADCHVVNDEDYNPDKNREGLSCPNIAKRVTGSMSVELK